MCQECVRLRASGPGQIAEQSGFSRSSSSSSVQTAAHILQQDDVADGLHGFVFDIETCRQAFNHYDKDKSGALDSEELKELAKLLWATFNPEGSGLDAEALKYLVDGIMGETDVNNDRQISFDEFIPWYRRMAQKYWLLQKARQQQPRPGLHQHQHPASPASHASTSNPTGPSSPAAASVKANFGSWQMHLLHNRLLKELKAGALGPDGAAVEQAAQQVLKGSKDIAASLRAASAQGKTASFAFHADDGEYHATMSRILQTGPRPVVSGPRQPERKAWGLEEVSQTAVAAVLEAYCNLATVGVEMLPQLVKVKGMAQGLMNAVEQGSADVKVYAVFLLSQLAIAGPETAIKIALMPGLPEACTRAISSSSKSGKLTFNWALLINNVAALGGEDAVRALTAHGMLVRELGAWLDNEHDAATLQRLTGVFNHLSRSVESARALQVHGIMDALRRMVARTSVSGTADAHEAYVGLAHMALANIAVRQGSSTAESGPGGGDGKAEGEGGKMEFEVASIKSIVGFLKCALEERALSGIRFRVYDVLYALASLCKCQERDVLGIECGLVDVAVQVTAEWKPGKYSSIFSDSKASTYPVLELSTDILMHLAHSEACRKRMHELYLESILDRLLQTAEGVVREHVSKVLWVLRDHFKALQAVSHLTAQVIGLRSLSLKYGGLKASKGQHVVSSLFTSVSAKVRQDDEFQASWLWLKESLLLDAVYCSSVSARHRADPRLAEHIAVLEAQLVQLHRLVRMCRDAARSRIRGLKEKLVNQQRCDVRPTSASCAESAPAMGKSRLAAATVVTMQVLSSILPGNAGRNRREPEPLQGELEDEVEDLKRNSSTPRSLSRSASAEEIQDAMSQLSDTLGAHTAEIRLVEDKHAAVIKAMEEEHKLLVKSIQDRHAKEIKGLESTLADAQGQVDHLRRALATATEQHERISGKVKQAQAVDTSADEIRKLKQQLAEARLDAGTRAAQAANQEQQRALRKEIDSERNAKAHAQGELERAVREVERWKSKVLELSVNEKMNAEQLEARDAEVKALQTSVASQQQQLKQAEGERDAVLLREDKLGRELREAENRLAEHKAAMALEHEAAIEALQASRTKDASDWQRRMREAQAQHAAELRELEKTAGEQLEAAAREHREAATKLQQQMGEEKRRLAGEAAHAQGELELAVREVERWKSKVQELSVNEKMNAEQIEARDAEVKALQTSVASQQQQLKQAEGERDAVLLREDKLGRELREAENRLAKHKAAMALEHEAAIEALQASRTKDASDWQRRMREAQAQHAAELRELEKTAGEQLEAAAREHREAATKLQQQMGEEKRRLAGEAAHAQGELERAVREVERWKSKVQELSVNEKMNAEQLEARDAEVKALQTSVASQQQQLKQAEGERDAVLLREDKLVREVAAMQSRHADDISKLEHKLQQAEQRAQELSKSLEAELCDKIEQAERRELEIASSLQQTRAGSSPRPAAAAASSLRRTGLGARPPNLQADDDDSDASLKVRREREAMHEDFRNLEIDMERAEASEKIRNLELRLLQTNQVMIHMHAGSRQVEEAHDALEASIVKLAQILQRCTSTSAEALQQVLQNMSQRQQEEHDRQVQQMMSRVYSLEEMLQDREKQFDRETSRLTVEAASLRDQLHQAEKRAREQLAEAGREHRQAMEGLRQQLDDDKDKGRLLAEATEARAELESKLQQAEQRAQELSKSLEAELCDKIEQAERRELEIASSLEKARAKQASPRKPPLSPRTPPGVRLGQHVKIGAALGAPSPARAIGAGGSGPSVGELEEGALRSLVYIDELVVSAGHVQDLLRRCVAVAAYEMERQGFEHEAQMKSMHIKVCSLEEFLEQCQEHIKALEDKITAMKEAKRTTEDLNRVAAAQADRAQAPRAPRLGYLLALLLLSAASVGVSLSHPWLADAAGKLRQSVLSMIPPSVAQLQLPLTSLFSSSQTCSDKGCRAGDSVSREKEKKRESGHASDDSADGGKLPKGWAKLFSFKKHK